MVKILAHNVQCAPYTGIPSLQGALLRRAPSGRHRPSGMVQVKSMLHLHKLGKKREFLGPRETFEEFLWIFHRSPVHCIMRTMLALPIVPLGCK